LTEPAGDLIFNCAFGGTPTTTATMTIDYGVPITNSTAYPGAGVTTSGLSGAIGVTNVAGFGGGAPTISAVTNASGQIVLLIPAQNAGATHSFTVSNVLLAISGSGKTTVSANVSVSPGNNVLITAGQTTAVVVTSVLPGIQNPTITPFTSPGLVLSTGTIVTGGFSVRVTENFIDMFRNAAQFNAGQSTNAVQLLFTFTGIPTGISFGTTGNPCTATMTSAAGPSGSVSAPVTAGGTNILTSTNNTLLVSVTGADLTVVERIDVACPNTNVGSTTTLPLTPGSVTTTVTLAPTGTAFTSTGGVQTNPTSGGQIPRYTSNPLPSPPLTVVNIIPATTNMLFPFVSIGSGFDTGFSIANTTGDPYGGTAFGGARPQSGTVAMYFFPTGGGASFCVTTGGTATNPVTGGTTATNCSVLASTNVGIGLTAGGLVAPGASWVVLGSEIFRAITGAPASFNGYVFAVSNFTNGHPSAFIADAAFSGGFTTGGPALVLNHPFIVPRVGPAVAEILGH
jgi:hypothetical protein